LRKGLRLTALTPHPVGVLPAESVASSGRRRDQFGSWRRKSTPATTLWVICLCGFSQRHAWSCAELSRSLHYPR